MLKKIVIAIFFLDIAIVMSFVIICFFLCINPQTKYYFQIYKALIFSYKLSCEGKATYLLDFFLLNDF